MVSAYTVKRWNGHIHQMDPRFLSKDAVARDIASKGIIGKFFSNVKAPGEKAIFDEIEDAVALKVRRLEPAPDRRVPISSTTNSLLTHLSDSTKFMLLYHATGEYDREYEVPDKEVDRYFMDVWNKYPEHRTHILKCLLECAVDNGFRNTSFGVFNDRFFVKLLTDTPLLAKPLASLICANFNTAGWAHYDIMKSLVYELMERHEEIDREIFAREWQPRQIVLPIGERIVEIENAHRTSVMDKGISPLFKSIIQDMFDQLCEVGEAKMLESIVHHLKDKKWNRQSSELINGLIIYADNKMAENNVEPRYGYRLGLLAQANALKN